MENYVPTYLMIATVVLLIAASFIPEEYKPSITNGLICVVIMLIGIVHSVIRNKDIKAALPPLKDIYFNTILLLAGLFVVVGGIENMGVVKAVANIFTTIGGDNLFLIYTLVVWMSVIFSAFIDNIPYVATMLPVMQTLAMNMGRDPTVLYFGLLSGATLGGNLTPIGASANITGIGILRKEGFEVKNSDFLRVGIPFTLAAVIPAYILIWIFYGI